MKSQSVRPAIFVLLALALSAPALVNIVSGADSMGTAGLYLAGAIIVAWLAVSGVGQLFDHYRANSTGRPRRHPEQGPTS